MSGTGSGDVIKLPSSRSDETIVFDDEPDPQPIPDSLTRGELSGPTRVGRYIVLEVIGVGGMGVVCTAYDPKLDRKVALKLLRKEARAGRGAASSMGRARLLREAQALAKLSHPNIVTVHDVDTTPDGRLYMAMEYVEGQTLAQWLASDARDYREVLEVFEYAGRGLAAAHAAGITHRDFKPANVLIGGDGRVRVLDFGLAKSATSDPGEDTDVGASSSGDAIIPSESRLPQADAKLTRAGRIVGTPAYMAPEQRRGKTVGPATDQFSFAVALYEGLYGFLPFRTEGKKARSKAPIEPGGDVKVPAWIFRILRRALSRDPAERFGSMAEMLAALRADPARRRRRVLVGVGAAGVVGLAVFGVLSAIDRESEVCRGAQERIGEVWGEARADHVGSALRATETAYAEYTAKRVVASLDDYAARWTSARAEVCEATRVHAEQSEALMDVRMSCLDGRRSELRALVGVLSEADEKTVERAVAAAHGLAEPTDCLTVMPGANNELPLDPKARARVLDIAARADDANALIVAGRYDEALEIAEAARSDATAAGHGPTLARATLYHGMATYLLRDYAKAETLLERAAILATESHDPALATRAWTKLVFVSGMGLRDPQRGLAWVTAAEASLAAADHPEDLQVDLAVDTATMLLQSGRFEEAVDACRSALAIAQGIDGDASPRASAAASNLGIALARTGAFEDARSALTEALNVADEVFGPTHPRAASVAQNLGNVLAELGEFEEATELLGRAREVRVALFGPDHSRVAELDVALARIDRKRDDLTSAAARLDKAIGIFERAGEHRRVAQTLNNLGALHLANKDARAAHEAFTRARKLLVAEDKPPAEILGRTDWNSCQASIESKEFAAAQEECARAQSQLDTVVEAPNSSLAGLFLTRAELAVHQGNRALAADLARKSLDAAKGLDPQPGSVDEATALLVSLVE